MPSSRDHARTESLVARAHHVIYALGQSCLLIGDEDAAADTDSMLAWLSAYQSQLLRSKGRRTTKPLSAYVVATQSQGGRYSRSRLSQAASLEGWERSSSSP